mmetsp:Transcript_38075/g.72995  ORF Transcript_38075/g.72995 Transcript_38075/m.72995 type:complete len:311 (-) Transcript_38075:169-1101(-)
MALARKLCIVTGANTGIGRIIATKLALSQARVIMACRSESRTSPVCNEIRESTGNPSVEVWPLDMCSLDSVRRFAARVGDQPVHVLVSNAGVMQGKHEVTEDGFEVTWQVNALAPHLLAKLLLPSLQKAAVEGGDQEGSARLVYVGSSLDKRGDLSDLQAVEDACKRFTTTPVDGKFDTFGAYGTSKLAATLLHMELARRTQVSDEPGSKGLCINVVSPGMVNTELNRNLVPWPLQWPVRLLLSLLLRSPDQGAETPMAVATSSDKEYVVTGQYFRDLKRMDRSDTIPIGNVVIAEQLWATCEAMLGTEI